MSPSGQEPLSRDPDGDRGVARRLEQGWSFVGIGSDSTLLAAAVTAEFGRARSVSKSPGGSEGRPPGANRAPVEPGTSS